MLTHRMSLLTLFIFLGFSTKAQALWLSSARLEARENYKASKTLILQEGNNTLGDNSSLAHKISLYEERDFFEIAHEHHTNKEKGFPYPYLSLFFEQNKDKQACWFTGKGSWKIIVGFKEGEKYSYKTYELNHQNHSNTSDSLELAPLSTSQDFDSSQTISIFEENVPKISFILLATSEFWHLCSEKNIATEDQTAEERIANYLHRYKEKASLENLPLCANALLHEILNKEANPSYFINKPKHKSLELIIVFPHDEHPNLKNN